MAATSNQAASSAASTSKSQSQSITTLLVSSLPSAYTSQSLSALLSAIGPIRTAFIVTSQTSPGQGKGYGFAKFVLKDDAEKAIKELDGTIIDGKRISVKWAQRRQRGAPGTNAAEEDSDAEDTLQNNASFVPLAENTNVRNAYAVRREAKRAARQGVAADCEKPAGGESGIDNAKDSRTVVLEGGLDVNDQANKKALQKKLKKICYSINTGSGALDPSQIYITASTHRVVTSNNEDATAITTVEPLVLLECPSSQVAKQLEKKLHDTVTKGCLVRAKNKWEDDTLSRKGVTEQRGGRLIIRNLAFDVTLPDIASAFASYGAIQTIRLLKGYAFITFITKASAQAALEGMNNKRIYAGMEKDRIQEAASHELSSIKRKKEKGKIVGVKGRMCAVDWALEKEQYMKLEAEANKASALPDEAKKTQNGGMDHDPDASDSDEDEDEEDSDEDEDEEDDLTPEPIDMNELEPPSEAEMSDEDAERDGGANGPKVADEGTTLFVRNIQFEATEDELYSLFKSFGAVKYARIVMDPKTKRSRGTGFVNFYKAEDALACLEESERLASQTGSSAGPASAKGKDNKAGLNATHQSLLTADPSSASAARLTLHGRVLGVSEAVSKGKADKLREERDRKGDNKDRRNLYLMHEGVILPDSPLASGIPTSDLQARESSFEARRALLRTNPALYISRTRLAIRQIPLFVSEGMLKRLAGWSCKAFESDVKRGRRSPLTLDELRETANALGAKAVAAEPAAEESMVFDGEEAVKATPKDKKKFQKGPSKVKQSKILRQDDRLDPLTGLKRSKGYGFLEMHSHADALRVIRWANANSAVHKLFHSWWMEDLKFQIERLSGDTGKKEISDTEKEVRIKRMKDKLQELEGEDEKSIARQGKTLIIEFSIENAVTVKRRDEKVDRVREKNKKRKRDTDEVEVEAKLPEMKVEPKADKVKKQEHNPLGSMIGKKRRLAKARKGK